MQLTKLTPNLFVRDVAAAMDYYCNVLGFTRGQTVPETAPYIFGIVQHGPVEIFFNDQKAVSAEHPDLARLPIGGALTLYIEVDAVDSLFQKVQEHGAKINMPLTDQFYGMREFGMIDPEGWMLTFAQRIQK
jgi:PhnB protein